MTFAARMARVAPSPTLKVAAEADRLRRAGVDVVDFGAGSRLPDAEERARGRPSRHRRGIHKYAVGRRRRCPRSVVAQAREDTACHTTGEVIVSAGAKQALYNAAVVLFDDGDEVIHSPFWPTIVDQVLLCGATPVLARGRRERGIVVEADEILDRVTPKTKAIILNSPCNPTGAVMHEDTVAAIADHSAKTGVWVIVDLTYDKLIYEPVPHNLVQVLTDRHRERTVICSSASKAYAMTGWRAGWSLGPKDFITACNTVQGHATSNVSSITQKALVEALTGPQDAVTTMLTEYRGRRDVTLGWLTSDSRVECLKPGGAFYLFPYLAELLAPCGVKTSAEFADQLLADARVALTAGEGFDAPGFVRISYATSRDRLREGVTRLQEFVHARQRGATTAR
jgi:aspartate aminotransferase